MARGVSGPSEDDAVAIDAMEEVRLRVVREDMEGIDGIGSDGDRVGTSDRTWPEVHGPRLGSAIGGSSCMGWGIE